MHTYIVDRATALAIWQNARWFSPLYFKQKKIGDDKYRVTTTYDASLFNKGERK